HDCGKIGIPGAILNKPGALDDNEFDLIKKHPAWGADVARQAQLSEVIVNIILYHHERYDGKGYPAGISGADIPVEARIVAVADVFDAVTSDRSYRKAYSMKKGLEIIMSMKGSSFDPEIVDLFPPLIECIDSRRQTEESR
ncbi:MAG: HD domain-containing protein, partial [Deferribacteres bacterium]|nr:HD domain-containing protein [Deferribacteres bacterium]